MYLSFIRLVVKRIRQSLYVSHVLNVCDEDRLLFVYIGSPQSNGSLLSAVFPWHYRQHKPVEFLKEERLGSNKESCSKVQDVVTPSSLRSLHL